MLVIVGAALCLAGLIWIVVTGWLALARLDRAHDELDAAKAAVVSGDTAKARAIADRLRDGAASAHAWTSGPAWWVGSHLPWLGAPLRSARELARSMDTLARTSEPSVAEASRAVSPDRLVTGPTQLDLGALAEAAAPLQAARQAAATAQQQLQSDTSDTWLPFINHLQEKSLRDVAKLGRALDSVNRMLAVLPPMLGADGVRHYFVAFENDAEARGLGGLPGAYGILTADHGALTFSRFGPEDDLLGARSTARLGPDFEERYVNGFSADTFFRNSDASPHFPYAAKTWLSMWENHFHERLDGAMATDPSALGYLLRSTGPVTLSDGQKLVPDNVALVLESDVYAKFPSLKRSAINARKDYLVQAARTIVDAITQHAADKPQVFLKAIVQAVREKRLVMFSNRPAEEATIATSSLGGELQKTTRPFVGLVINNTSGSKLDYYLDSRLTYQRSTCAASTATVTVTLHNDAPARGLPAYVTYTTGIGRGPAGQNQDEVALYLTHNADLAGPVTLDGRRQFIQQSSERGHPVVSLNVKLLPGQTRTLKYRVSEPPATGPVVVPVQPLVRGLLATVKAPTCADAAA